MRLIKARVVFVSMFLFVATVNLQGAWLSKKNNLDDVIDIVSSMSASKVKKQVKAEPQVRAVKINESKLADVIEVIATLKDSFLKPVIRVTILQDPQAQKRAKEAAEAKRIRDAQILNYSKQTIQAFFLNEIKSSYLSTLTADQEAVVNQLEKEAKDFLWLYENLGHGYGEFYNKEGEILTFYSNIITYKYYNDHKDEYPELKKFIEKYSCSQDLEQRKKYIVKKDSQISRIINAERSKKCIQENNLNLLGIPDKCLMLTPEGFILYATKVEHQDLPKLSEEQDRQFKLFQTLTGFSDVSGNILYDPKVNKIMIIDLEDDSFLDPRVNPTLSENTRYDDPFINFEKVKEEFELLSKLTRKEINKVAKASDKYWQYVKESFQFQLNLVKH